jgi:uncharacterized delta-60 repeat protein
MRSASCIRFVLALVAAVLGTGCAATPAAAEDGDYIVEPWVGGYSDVKIQPGDQKIVVTGRVESTGALAIARYNPAGIPDSGFGSGGLSIPPDSLVANLAGLLLQPDGKAVVAARHCPEAIFGAARFRSNGSLDTSFGNRGWCGVPVSPYLQIPNAVARQSTGKLVVAGLTHNGTVLSSSGVLARFTTSGALDSGKGGFGTVGKGGQATGYTISPFGAQLVEFWALAIQPDDKVVAVGYFSSDGSFSGHVIVARYTAAGLLDTTFNGGGYTVLNPPGMIKTSFWNGRKDVALQSDGKIVVVSTAPAQGALGHPWPDMLVARFNTNGTLDTGFGGGSGYVWPDFFPDTSELAEALAIQPDGKIVVAGSTYLSEPTFRSGVLVVRLNPDGTPDETFGGSGFKLGSPPAGPDYHSFQGKAVALQSDGTIIVAGNDDRDSTDNFEFHPLLMRFDP